MPVLEWPVLEWHGTAQINQVRHPHQCVGVGVGMGASTPPVIDGGTSRPANSSRTVPMMSTAIAAFATMNSATASHSNGGDAIPRLTNMIATHESPVTPKLYAQYDAAKEQFGSNLGQAQF